MVSRKLSTTTTSIGGIPWPLKDRISVFKVPTERFKNATLPQYESDAQVIERFMLIIEGLVKIKKRTYKIPSQRCVELEQLLEYVNLPSKNPVQTYQYRTQGKKTVKSRK